MRKGCEVRVNQRNFQQSDKEITNDNCLHFDTCDLHRVEIQIILSRQFTDIC